MKKYILFILGAAFLLATILFGAYFRGYIGLSSSVLQTRENITTTGIAAQNVPIDILYGDSPTSRHAFGSPNTATKSWSSTAQDGVGHLTFGPYKKYETGFYSAIFELQIDNILTDPEEEIIRIDIFDPFRKEKLAEKKIYRRDFQESMQKQGFVLPFEIGEESRGIEYRVYVLGRSYVEHFKTTVVRDERIDILYGDSPTSRHAFGSPNTATKSWSSTAQDGVGHLTFGPYKKYETGFYSAIFELQIDNILTDPEEEIIRIDIFDPFRKEKLAEKKIYRKDFQESMQKQGFVLPFEIGEESRGIEYRVYVLGRSYVEHFKTTVVRNKQIFIGHDPSHLHNIGIQQGSSWKAAKSAGRGYMTYGPFIENLSADVHTASFQLGIDTNQGSDDIVAELQIFDTNAQQVIQRRMVKRSHFYRSNTPQDFDVNFEINKKTLLEFRILVYGRADITHYKTQIYSDGVTMNDLWDKRAYFDFYDKKVFRSALRNFPELDIEQESSTAPIYTLDGVWYTLNRQKLKRNFENCTTGFTFRTVIRKSTDQGRTWSEAVLMDPNNGPTDGMCNNTDGSLFFDQETGIWHFITQCIPPGKIRDGARWGLCHYTRDSISPMGLFTPNSQNPVVKNGTLFQKLCREMGNQCPELIKINPNNSGNPWENILGMHDEGTPQITEKRDGYFYVTYHGAHSQNTRGISLGARAIAKTRDFITWEVTGTDLPNNLMLSNADCASWNPDGQIGAGVQIRSGGYNYVLSECPEKTIALLKDPELSTIFPETKSQPWNYGLNRNRQYGPTGTWENYPHNPFISYYKPGGFLPQMKFQYGKLFRDRGNIYMATLVNTGLPLGPENKAIREELSRYGVPLYIYKLTPGTNGPVNYQIPGNIDIHSGDRTHLLQD